MVSSGCIRLTVGDTVIRLGFRPPTAQYMIRGCSLRILTTGGWIKESSDCVSPQALNET